MTRKFSPRHAVCSPPPPHPGVRAEARDRASHDANGNLDAFIARHAAANSVPETGAPCHQA